jgi:alpha-L-rhamnosidase
MTYSKASYESVYGVIKSGWETKDGKTTVRVRIPSNTTATVILPAESVSGITEGGKPLTGAADFSNIRTTDKKVTFEAGSGEYVFEF